MRHCDVFLHFLPIAGSVLANFVAVIANLAQSVDDALTSCRFCRECAANPSTPNKNKNVHTLKTGFFAHIMKAIIVCNSDSDSGNDRNDKTKTKIYQFIGIET